MGFHALERLWETEILYSKVKRCDGTPNRSRAAGYSDEDSILIRNMWGKLTMYALKLLKKYTGKQISIFIRYAEML